MSSSESGDRWTVEVTDGVMIWEFLEGMELDAFETEAFPVYERLLSEHDADGMVTVVGLDDPFTEAVFDVWEESAKRADEAGIGRWAVVAEGIKSISIRGKIDTGGLEVYTTEDRSEAIEWAR